MSPRMKYVAGLLSTTLLLASSGATAQGLAKNRGARSDLPYQEAQALLAAGQVDAACSKLEASQTLENRLATLLELGDCYERANRTASAWHTFQQAEALAQLQKDAEVGQVAAQRVAALEPKLIRVEFVVPMTSRVPGLTVRLGENTVPPSSWGSPIPVDAGVQRVSASARGYRPWSLEVDARRAEGRPFRVNVPTLAPAPEVRPTASRGSAQRTAGVVTGSFGLAGIGAGALFSAMSRNANDSTTCSKGVVQCTPNSSNKSAYSDAARSASQ
jgi:hypothetical protein